MQSAVHVIFLITGGHERWIFDMWQVAPKEGRWIAYLTRVTRHDEWLLALHILPQYLGRLTQLTSAASSYMQLGSLSDSSHDKKWQLHKYLDPLTGNSMTICSHLFSRCKARAAATRCKVQGSSVACLPMEASSMHPNWQAGTCLVFSPTRKAGDFFPRLRRSRQAWAGQGPTPEEVSTSCLGPSQGMEHQNLRLVWGWRQSSVSFVV